MKNAKAGKNVPKHVSQGSVFDSLGFSESESAALKIKADLYRELLQLVKQYGLSQRDLQRILDQPQPRISELLNGKISMMSIEKLVNYLDRLGAHASVKVTAPKKPVFRQVA